MTNSDFTKPQKPGAKDIARRVNELCTGRAVQRPQPLKEREDQPKQNGPSD